MREIKFRIWDNERDELICWSKEKETFNIIYCMKNPQVYSLMQYTGLKDKNGVEIYEGDVVKQEFKTGTSYIGEVKLDNYSDGEYVSSVQCYMACGDVLSDNGGLHAVPKHTWEVIGNIHENPELLETK